MRTIFDGGSNASLYAASAGGMGRGNGTATVIASVTFCAFPCSVDFRAFDFDLPLVSFDVEADMEEEGVTTERAASCGSCGATEGREERNVWSSRRKRSRGAVRDCFGRMVGRRASI